jgi:hypothetical protein
MEEELPDFILKHIRRKIQKELVLFEHLDKKYPGIKKELRIRRCCPNAFFEVRFENNYPFWAHCINCGRDFFSKGLTKILEKEERE